MKREIIAQDVIKVKEILLGLFGSENYSELSRMGGLTNHTYKVVIDDDMYSVRIPGEGTEAMINRTDEKVSTKLACEIGIDANLLYFDDKGVKVTEYIKNAVTMSAESLRDLSNIKLVAEVLKKLHSCGADTKVSFDVFEMAESYEKIIKINNVDMYGDYAYVKSRVKEIKSEIDSLVNIKKVPCHNDPLCENWVKSNDRMYLIDWEYAGMNDGMWDVADVSTEAGFTEELDTIILREYLGREPEVADKKHMLANKIYADYLWTLWAKTRVPYDGQPMEDWAAERYQRLKIFISQYEK